jgi:ADP-dependent NAD(P)H-hydrate dehydratase
VLLQHASDVTFIIDAMCVTGLWDHRRLTSRRKRQLIITPHPGEMAALTGLSKSHINHDPVSVAEKVASHLQCVVVLKGSSTVVAQPDGPSYRYPGGGVGLATSGSGDVLAGVLAGLVARGAPAVEAAIWSVYLHGEAGRRLAERIGPLGFLARELPLEIPGLMAAFPG